MERALDDLNLERERPTYASLSTPPRAAPPAPAPRRSSAPWIIAAIAIAFALGLIANPWFERTVRARLPGRAVAVTPDTNAAAIRALQERIAQLEATQREPAASPPAAAEPATPTDTDARLAQINEGIAGVAAKVDANAERADAALTSANEGAERAQTLLLVATTRHALETGSSLATLGPGLRKAFPNQTAAVDAVIAGGSPPVTLAKLRADFLRLQPARMAASTSWLGSLRQGLGEIVQVRRADSPAATGLTGRPLASQRLLAGDVAGAVTALGDAANPAWLAEAGRYLAAQRGLAALEAATVVKAAVSPAP